MLKRILVIGFALLAVAPVAQAQRHSAASNSVELGIDGGVIFGLDKPSTTVVSLPLQDFRIGFMLSDALELEPRFNLNSIHSGGGSLTSYTLELGALLTPGGRGGRGLYLRPFAGLSGVHVTGGGNDNSGYAGAGFGVKLPFADRRLASRLEANYAHGFSNGGSNQIGILAGLSFFIR